MRCCAVLSWATLTSAVAVGCVDLTSCLDPAPPFGCLPMIYTHVRIQRKQFWFVYNQNVFTFPNEFRQSRPPLLIKKPRKIDTKTYPYFSPSSGCWACWVHRRWGICFVRVFIWNDYQISFLNLEMSVSRSFGAQILRFVQHWCCGVVWVAVIR